jgi:hypothetical protein
MAININKGSPLGKYYYSKDNNVFGPIPLEELLKIIDGDTYVYYDGIDWTKAKELPELKKIVGKISEDLPKTTIQSSEYSEVYQPEKKKFPWSIVAIGAPILLIFYFLSKSNTASVNNTDVALDTVSAVIDSTAMTPQIISYSIDDVYNNILSQSYISATQLDNLLYVDLVDYKNELLARHGYIFEEQGLVDYYNTRGWYSPTNNYLVATSQFNQYESTNFNLIDNKLAQIQSNLTSLIQRLYTSITDKTFDANNFFAENVDQYIKKTNLTSSDINNEMILHYEEFVNSKFTFSDPIQLNILRKENGYNYISFEVHYEVERVSKMKLQKCDVIIELGLDMNNRIFSYVEKEIKNLSYSDIVIAQSDTLINQF